MCRSMIAIKMKWKQKKTIFFLLSKKKFLNWNSELQLWRWWWWWWQNIYNEWKKTHNCTFNTWQSMMMMMITCFVCFLFSFFIHSSFTSKYLLLLLLWTHHMNMVLMTIFFCFVLQNKPLIIFKQKKIEKTNFECLFFDEKFDIRSLYIRENEPEWVRESERDRLGFCANHEKKCHHLNEWNE